jgi:poly(A) polymerase
MQALGVLAEILPEADVPSLAALVAQEQAQGIAPVAIRHLAALIPADVTLAAQIASRFRLSGVQKKRLMSAANRPGATALPQALAYRLGVPEAVDALLLAGRDATGLGDFTPHLPSQGRPDCGTRRRRRSASRPRAVQCRGGMGR